MRGDVMSPPSEEEKEETAGASRASTWFDLYPSQKEEVEVRGGLWELVLQCGNRLDKINADLEELLEGERYILETLEKQFEGETSEHRNMRTRVKAIKTMLDHLLEHDIDRMERVLMEVLQSPQDRPERES